MYSLKRTIVFVILDKYFRCNNLICTSYIYHGIVFTGKNSTSSGC